MLSSPSTYASPEAETTDADCAVCGPRHNSLPVASDNRHQRVPHRRYDDAAGNSGRSRDAGTGTKCCGARRPLQFAGERVDGKQAAFIRRVAGEDRRTRNCCGTPISETGIHRESLSRCGAQRAGRRQVRLRHRQYCAQREANRRAHSTSSGTRNHHRRTLAPAAPTTKGIRIRCGLGLLSTVSKLSTSNALPI